MVREDSCYGSGGVEGVEGEEGGEGGGVEVGVGGGFEG